MRILKNISYFLAAVVLARALGFAQTYILARALGPADFGVWITLMLVVAYGPIGCLGSIEALLKQVPFYLGKHDLRRVREIEAGVMGSIVLSAIAVVIIGLGALLLLPASVLAVNGNQVLMIMGTVIATYFSGYFYNRFAAYENFKATGLIDFFRAAAAVLLVGGMGWGWGLPGAVAGYLLTELAICAAATASNVRTNGRVGVSFRKDLIIRAIRIGFPITLVWWILILQNSVDRIVLGSLMGALAVGHYGLGISLTNALAIVPMVVGRVLYPRVNRELGGEADADSMKRLVLAPTLALGVLLANLQIVLMTLMPVLYNQLLPKYQPGLQSGIILILGSYFICLLRNGTNYLIATNNEGVLTKYVTITLAFNVALNVTLVKLGWRIEGVAIGTSLAGALLTTLVWRRVLDRLGFDGRAQAAVILAVYQPLIVLITGFGLLRLVHPPAFQVFDRFTIGCGIVLLFVVNGALYCTSMYRTELHRWKAILWKKTRSNLNGGISPHGLEGGSGLEAGHGSVGASEEKVFAPSDEEKEGL